MLAKIIILLALFAVVANLFTALFHLIRGGQGSSARTLKFLKLRLVLSIAVFGTLYVLAHFGLIQPHGFPDASHAPAAVSSGSASS